MYQYGYETNTFPFLQIRNCPLNVKVILQSGMHFTLPDY